MRRLLLFLTACCLAAVPAAAQRPIDPLGGLGGGFDGDDPAEAKPTIEFSLHPAQARPGETVTLAVRVTVPKDYYTYDQARPTDETLMKAAATTITVAKFQGLEPTDKALVPDHPAKEVDDELLGKTRKFFKQVTWRQRFRLAADAKADSVRIEGSIRLQICHKSGFCLPPKTFPIAVALGKGPDWGTTEAASGAGGDEHPFEARVTPTRERKGQQVPIPVAWTFRLSPADAQPGQAVELHLTAKLDEKYHIFAMSQDPKNAGKPTRFQLQGLRGLKPVGRFQEDRKFEAKTVEIPALEKKFEQRIFHDTVTWTATFEVTPSGGDDGYGVLGTIHYQYCDPFKCTPARVTFALGQVSASDTVPDFPAQAAAGGGAFDLDNLNVKARHTDWPLWWMLMIAFAAGLILNVMPCVLPVIGLKIMSFVEQAGESRRQSFLLNLWFSLGMMSVYMVLATLAMTIGLGWGAQFADLGFNIVLVAVVFVFALSFLGVWEIPIPGFSSTPSAGGYEREGPVGAFSKGALTTVLATPCSGPLLLPALTYAVSMPPPITFLGFFMVGLGMASPYLLIGAFPILIGFLPKPGMWMETFKYVMGFVLLGTVVWLLTIVASVSMQTTVPLIGFLFSLWAACWWFGRVPMTRPRKDRLWAVVQGGAFAAIMGWLMFSPLALGGVMSARFDSMLDSELSRREKDLAKQTTQAPTAELDWQPYSQQRLTELVGQGKTVFIDFTADW